MKYKFVLGAVVSSLLFVSGHAVAGVQGIDKITVTSIRCIKTAGAIDDLGRAALVAAGTYVGTGIGGVSGAAAGPAGVVTGGATGAIGGASAGNAAATYLDKSDTDDLIATLMSVTDPTKVIYLQHTGNPTYSKKFEVHPGDVIRPNQAIQVAYAVSVSKEQAIKHHIYFAAQVQLWEHDVNSANDDLGHVKIKSVTQHKLDRPDHKGDSYSDKIIVKQDEAEYEISYKVEANAGTCSGLGTIGKAIYKGIHKKDCK